MSKWHYGDVLRSKAAPENKAIIMFVMDAKTVYTAMFFAKVLVETGGKFPSGLGITVQPGWLYEHWELIDD